ncbi:MAG: ribosomal protein S18-alanine N-acetyltransferase [Chloroflexi bacterium]|nr:ribosomal protein S18-alanine N-acetyltransferase [Chloroflexota bacterium]
MEPEDIPSVVAIDRLSFSTPWPASSYAYELNYAQESFYTVLLRPDAPFQTPIKKLRRPSRRWRTWLREAMGSPNGDRGIIGYLGVRLKPDSAHISTIAVHPDWRGRGLGELLLFTAIEKGWELDQDQITLEVRASNTVAQSLYRKYGFRFTGIDHGYYRDGEDAWLMTAVISHSSYRRRLIDFQYALQERLRTQSVQFAPTEMETHTSPI